MKVTITIPGGEATFDIEKERVTRLMNAAIELVDEEYNGRDVLEGELEPEPELTEEPELPQEAEPNHEEVPESTEAVVQSQQEKRHRRVDSLFPGFKPAQPEKVQYNHDDGYSGFLMIECASCGEVREFCSKKKIKYNRCRCGAQTELKDLRNMIVECKNCGRKSRYFTNLQRRFYIAKCIDCGAPVEARLNDKGTTYITA